MGYFTVRRLDFELGDMVSISSAGRKIIGRIIYLNKSTLSIEYVNASGDKSTRTYDTSSHNISITKIVS